MLTLLLPLLLAQAPPAKAVDLEAKWGKNIAAIEAKLKERPPKEGGVMFAGSSTIVRWDLDKYFPGKGYINVGFGGSKLADCVHFAPRILQPFKPGTVVIACGGNDIAAGVTPEQIAEDFKALVAAVRKTSPSCSIVFTSIKPTLKRAANWDKEQKANALIREICTKGDRLTFIDFTKELLGADGKAKREMLVDDLLHPSHEAYMLMAAKVKEAIEKAPAPPDKKTKKDKDPEIKWNDTIAAIEKKLKAQAFKEGGVMFAGASPVTRWKLENYFPGKGYANVGFGGSKIAQSVYFTPRLEQAFKPAKIVFISGGNDLASGLTPEQVLKDFEAYVAAVHKAVPNCKILFVSIRPTIRRESQWKTQQKANTLIEEYCSKDSTLTFLDVTKDMLGADGKPKREMLVDDLQHPSHECYVLLAAKLKDFLEK